MSWFDQKKRISESDLIAYHLHELSPRREREVARALERSATLAADSTAIATTLHAVKDAPQPIDQAAFARTWQALQPALQSYPQPLGLKPRSHTPVLTKAAFAGLAVLGAGIVATGYYRTVPRSPLTAFSGSDTSPVASIAMAPTSSELPAIASKQGPSPALSPRHIRFTPSPSGPEVLPLTPSSPNQVENLLSPLLTQTPTLPLEPQPAPPTVLLIPSHQSSSTPASGLGKGRLLLSVPSHGTDLMLALGGTLIPTHSSYTAGIEPRSITATAAIAGMAAFHQQFRPVLGYRVTLSYTKPDFQYNYNPNPGSGSYGNIDSHIFEAAGTYVVQGPHHGRWSTSADAGAAVMAFLPTDDPAASYAYRPAAVAGASADFAISRHWTARATYRAQVFRTPDFRYTGGTVPVTASIVLSHEPWFGLVYRFGKTGLRPPKP